MPVGDPVVPVRVWASYKQAWTNTFSAFGVLLGATLLYVLVQAPTSAIAPFLPEDPSVGVLVGMELGQLVYVLLLAVPFAVGLNWMHLHVSRGEGTRMGDFLEGWRIWPLAVGATALVMVFVLAGFVLLVLPGIYVGVRLTFTPYVLLDRREGAMAALKGSWELTRGRFWSVLGLGLLGALFVLLGFVALIVGVFVAIPWTQQAIAVYYRSMVEAASVPAEAPH